MFWLKGYFSLYGFCYFDHLLFELTGPANLRGNCKILDLNSSVGRNIFSQLFVRGFVGPWTDSSFPDYWIGYFHRRCLYKSSSIHYFNDLACEPAPSLGQQTCDPFYLFHGQQAYIQAQRLDDRDQELKELLGTSRHLACASRQRKDLSDRPSTWAARKWFGAEWFFSED